MAYLKVKTVKGHRYGYIVQGVRENKKVKQEVLEYLGRLDPSPDSNLKVTVKVVSEKGMVPISISRKLFNQPVLIEYRYHVLPKELMQDVRELIHADDT